jgi:mono/diheme cytochrome c family protein
MSSTKYRSLWLKSTVRGAAILSLLALLAGGTITARKPAAGTQTESMTGVQPLLKKYCLACHSTKVKKGSLDLERFTSLAEVRKDLKVWQGVLEQLEAGEMPPKKKPQPTAEERKQLIAWTRAVLDAEARARIGDPGHVPLRRLSNAEYDCTIRDLTGVELRPASEFPRDGAAGEGFTNAAEALTDIAPPLLNKYLNAAKDIAAHAVLLPDGFRFSPSKTRRDWTDESTAGLRRFYAEHAPADGRLPLRPYLAAAVRHRRALLAGMIAPKEVAIKERLNPKYFAILWQTLTDKTPSYPLDAIRAHWRMASEKDVPALVAEVAAWQAVLWKTARIGSYVRPEGKRYVENTTRQVAVDPSAAGSVPLRVTVKPAPGQAEVVLYLAARELAPADGGNVVWQRPRFEGPGKPALLLRDYAEFGAAFEIDYPSVFVGSAKYLAAAVEAANDRKVSLEELAKKHNLDAPFLKRWIEVLALEPARKVEEEKTAPAVPLQLLEDKTRKDDNRPAINGWRKKGTDLPVLVTNSSDKVEQIPGRVSPHGVAVHPLPREFVAVTWKSPVAADVRIQVRVAHAHPACGNGVAWRLEHRRAERATVLDKGTLDLGKEAKPPARTRKVEKGDQLVLAVDARDGNHVCDLTEIGFTVTETVGPRRTWDLAADVADSVLDGNPHQDRHGNAATWSFVRGASQGGNGRIVFPPDSVLGRWRAAAADPKRQSEAAKLAGQVETLLSGPRLAQPKSPDGMLYDKLVAVDSPLLASVDAARLAKPRRKEISHGLPRNRFGKAPSPQPSPPLGGEGRVRGAPVDDASVVAASDSVIEVRLPAALFAGREFVVEGRLDDVPGARVVQFRVLTMATPRAEPLRPTDVKWDGASPVLASPNGANYKRLLQGYADFRRVFPLFLCFPQVVPNDEVVTLKMFHREDAPLARLFLDAEQLRCLDRLWTTHRFISRQPVAENKYLPLFIGFVTQDQPKTMLAFFEGQRPAFKRRADEFLKEEEAAIPKQLDALVDFASRAYRRPLRDKEKADLLALYQTIRDKGAEHEEAFRGVLARILVSPAFLFRIEETPPGKEPAAVNDWELATRLSYFLWSSMPDDELRMLAATGRLRDPKVLSAQVRRMLRDNRLRALAIEFGTQWIHVRGFDELKEKNEKLFPEFIADVRKAIYEESILFFQDLFQSDRPVTRILDADYTFLNETLAKHYGIRGVTGPQWRRVEGVRKYGRGGVLGLASVQTKQAGASRTSPVLRGNWVVETLLGEKLPRPPADVPRLPEAEGDGGLTVRQQVEKHAKSPSCAACHVRIDPFGFALEKYDSIGRLRTKDLGGLPVDARAKLRDGTEFEGIEGLRNYLLSKKKDVIVRLFCRRLLGYALGRAVTLSDQSLIDEMIAELDRSEGRVGAAVQAIVRSPQFRKIRGRDYTE